MDSSVKLFFGVTGFIAFALLLIFQSFILTSSYLEMANMYDKTVAAANTAHELSTSKAIINEIGMNDWQEDTYLYNEDEFKKTFETLMAISQVNLDNIFRGSDEEDGAIYLEYTNGNSARIAVEEDTEATKLNILFEYNINFSENIDTTISRVIPIEWDVKRKASGGY